MEHPDPNWGVIPEKKQASSYIKKNISPSTIINVNNNNLRPNPNDNQKIKIPHKDYEIANKVHISNNINNLYDVQQAFNSNPSRNLETKDEVSFSNAKINQEYKQKIQSSEIRRINNHGKGKPKNQSPHHPSNIKNLNIQPSNKLVNIQYNENSGLINNFSEVFPQLDKSVISKIIKENPDLPEHKLYEILSDLVPGESSQTQKDLVQRVPKAKTQLKKYLCMNTSECSNPNCEFYHSQGERRRLLDGYSCKMCLNDKCEAHEACSNSHTLSEIFFHPSLYKKLLCPFKECPLKHLCKFSHGHFNAANGLAEKLEENIEELYKKKKSLLEISNKTNEEISRLYLEKEKLRNRLVCSICTKFRIEYVSIPCSHSLCGKCIEEVGNRQICLKCNVQVELVRIDYN